MNALFDPNQLRLISPEIVLTVAAFLVLGLSAVDESARRIWAPGLSLLACAGTLLALLAFPYKMGLDALRVADATIGFSGMFFLDAFAIFFKVVFLLAGMLAILLSDRYLDRERANSGEYYALVLLAIVGMMFLASAGDFTVVFVALETMALSFYVLVGYLKTKRKSNEAALKYFLLGSFSSAILLYGISLVFGATGTTNLGLIGFARHKLGAAPDLAPLFFLGIILIIVGLAFKVAAAPFHMWAPDAYEGAPTPITAFLSTASMAAAFVVFARIFSFSFLHEGDRWALPVAVLAAASMTWGNIAAILQDNVKRMLAYSSVAHAGYVLLGFVAMGRGDTVQTREFGLQAILLYMLIYAFVTLGAFAMVILLHDQQMAGDRVSDFAGLSSRAPWSAFAMLVFLLSLAGIPATAGFVGKWYLFGAAVKAHATWLAVIAVLNSAVSLYYYARIVVMMYMKAPAREERLAPSLGQRVAIGTCIAFTIVFGIYPQPIIAFAQRSILALAPWAS